MSKYNNFHNANRNTPEVAPSVESGGLDLIVAPEPENVPVPDAAELGLEVPVPNSSIETLDDAVEYVHPMIPAEVLASEPKYRVRGCDKLNVRKRPNMDADVVGIIGKLEQVTVIEEGSTDDFYKVIATIDGLEMSGYCLKEYIK